MDITCTIDSREKERIPYSMEFFKKYNPSIKELDTGDYIFDNGKEKICFEYKTIRDFIGSVNDNRIFEQVKRMNDKFDWSFIVLEGTIEDLRRENKRRLFQKNTGQPFSLNQFYGVIARLNCYSTVVQCHNQAQSFNLIEKQALKIFDDAPLSKHFKNDADNPALNYLNCIGGIGFKTGKLIVDEFNIKSLNDLLAVVENEDLTSINGIGKKTEEIIMEAIK